LEEEFEIHETDEEYSESSKTSHRDIHEKIEDISKKTNDIGH